MDPALNTIIAPWAQMGIVGSIVLALGVTVWLQWRHIVDLYAAHLADVKACAAANADLDGIRPLHAAAGNVDLWMSDWYRKHDHVSETSGLSMGGRRGGDDQRAEG